eukprot:gene8121-8991_t
MLYNYFLAIVLVQTLLVVCRCSAADPAVPCDVKKCKLPECQCSGRTMPAMPQIITITWQGAVTSMSVYYYERMIQPGRNPNNCAFTSTYYTTHKDTDYGNVKQLYLLGQEIAVYGGSDTSVAKFPKTEEQWLQQIQQQRNNINKNAEVPLNAIGGYRDYDEWPLGGNNQFSALSKLNFSYDSSMRSIADVFWPYSLDYKSTQDCRVPVCPTDSYPGLWEMPMLTLYDKNNNPCAYPSECKNITTADDVYNLLLNNFKRHYEGNRAPFPFFLKESWFGSHWFAIEGISMFVNHVASLPDVYAISMNQTLEWVKNPTPLTKIADFKPWKC